MKHSAAKDDYQLIYQLDGRPRLRVAIPLGLQHILSMFVGNLAPVFILTGALSSGGVQFPPELRVLMIQCAMLMAGLVTLVQLYPIKLGIIQIGARLPIVAGTAFAFVPTFQSIGERLAAEQIPPTEAMGFILGGVVAGSFAEIIFGIFLKPLRRLFPPLVVGSVLITIGISLLGTGAMYFVGGANAADAGSPQYWLVGGCVFLVTVILNRYGHGMWKATALLIGIVVGYILAAFVGMVNFEAITGAAWVSVPMPMNEALMPHYRLDVIMPIAAIYVVSALESLGNTNGITVAALDREATADECSGSILADGVGSFLAGFYNILPNTAFGQNAGIVAMTRVVNRFCIATGAIILILAAFVPKIGALFSAMPNCVMGGAVITVFAMIMHNGIKMICLAGFSEHNNLIFAITFGMGYGVSLLSPAIKARFPEILQIVFMDKIAAVCLVGAVACLLFGDGRTSDPPKPRVEDEDT